MLLRMFSDFRRERIICVTHQALLAETGSAGRGSTGDRRAERFFLLLARCTARANATVAEAAGSHAIYISKPEVVATLIAKAATSVTPRSLRSSE